MTESTLYEENGALLLKVEKGREHELQIEQDILDKNDFMHPAYLTALKALKEIIRNTNNWYIRHDAKHCPQYSNDLYGFANNVIAFCGARGQGKTSAMISFANAIGFPNCRTDKSRSSTDDEIENDNQSSGRNADALFTEIVRGYRFFILPPIDPTMLSNENALIEMILTNLLDEFTKLWDRGECKRGSQRQGFSSSDDAKKYEVLRLIEDCRTGIHTERGAAKAGHDSNFEVFARANDIFTLKKNLHKTIQELFRLRGWDIKKSFLVIELDDTDMHLDSAYRIAEDARKYLSLPNTVVLMATELNQLRLTVEWYYRKTMNIPGQTPMENFHFGYKAAKYIDKLIPVSQTAHLPTLHSQYDLGKSIYLQVNRDDETQKTSSLPEFQAVIFKMIYEKTGLAFIRHDSMLHELIPSTLRGYMHLYRFLNQMETPAGEKTLEKWLDRDKDSSITKKYCEHRIRSLKTKLSNLSEFENYFLNDWIPSRIHSLELQEALKNFLDVPVSHLFSYALEHLLNEKRDPTKPYLGEYGRFLNQLDQKRRFGNSTEEFNFVFVIGTYTSIQLHKRIYNIEINELNKWANELQMETIDDEWREKARVFDFSELVQMIMGNDAQQSEITDDLIEAFQNDSINCGLYVQCCIRLLENDARNTRYNREKFEGFIGGLRLQDRIVYFCCNWDVIHQIYEHTSELGITISSEPDNYKNQCQIIWIQMRNVLTRKTEKDDAIRDDTPPFEDMPDLFGQLLLNDLDPDDDMDTNMAASYLSDFLGYLVALRSAMKDPDFFDPDNIGYLNTIYEDIEKQIGYSLYQNSALTREQTNKIRKLVRSSREAAEKGDIPNAKGYMTRLISSIKKILSKINNHEADQQGS